jgi:hypothetical protein
MSITPEHEHVTGEKLPKRATSNTMKEHVAWYSKKVRLDCLDVMHLVEQLFTGVSDAALPVVQIPLKFCFDQTSCGEITDNRDRRRIRSKSRIRDSHMCFLGYLDTPLHNVSDEKIDSASAKMHPNILQTYARVNIERYMTSSLGALYTLYPHVSSPKNGD